jgi:UMF1 family MFS transporter
MTNRPRDHARTVRAWCLYDWANSAFAATVMAALYPPFFRSLAVAGGLSESRATAAWGYTASIALAIVAVSAPVLGAIADHTGTRKRFLGTFAVVGVAATASFTFNGDDTWLLAAGLYILANIGFAGGNVFYESLLPSVASPVELDRVSARGYALGYLGGGILLVVNALWVVQPRLFGMPDAGTAVRAAFLSVAVWWALFSMPLFRRVPEPPADPRPGAPTNPVAAGFGRLAVTFREIRRYRHLLVFLVAFWIYNDGISTIIKMATAYGDEIGIGVPDMIAALAITQFVGFPFALLFGRLGERIGTKSAILLALAIYAVICVGGFFMTTPLHFYLLATAVGTVQGGSQALSRSLFAAMVPRHKTAEFFGFFGASGKFAGIFGPLLFAVISQLTGESRLSIVALIVFFLVGGMVLTRVDVAGGVQAAREAERQHDSRGNRPSESDTARQVG